MKFRIQNSLPRRQAGKFKILVYTLCFALFVSSIGCEAFVRKFTRKSQREGRREVPIFEPQEYNETVLANDELYKNYFVFWESWVSELLSFLKENANAKKQKECVSQALDNLNKMQSLLKEEKATELGYIISEFGLLRNRIMKTNADFTLLKNKVERIKSKVHKNFAFSKIKKDIKY